MLSIDDYFQGALKANRANMPYLVLNNHAGQFCKAKCKVMRQLRTEDQMGLKNKCVTKTEYLLINFGVLWCLMF